MPYELLYGTNGLQRWAGMHVIEDKSGKRHVYNKFVFGNETPSASHGIQPRYLDSEEEALEAAVTEARSSRSAPEVNVFNCKERLEQSVEDLGYKTDISVQIDSALNGIFLRKRGRSPPKIRVKYQPSSDRSKGKQRGYDRTFNFSGPATLELSVGSPPMPYELPVVGGEQVFTTQHVMSVEDHAQLSDDEREK